MIAFSKTQHRTENRSMRHVGFAVMVLVAGGWANAGAQAAPPIAKLPLMTPAGDVKPEAVRCNCRHRYHFRRRAVRVVPNDYVPVYPAPAVGFTFRKLFDAGYF